ncbi:extracellular solute-binding protein [Candidatus Aerophobetes bacterium]|nr:extracellular solute-binding protein [Candidatus Aerophobetes bacterium]
MVSQKLVRKVVIHFLTLSLFLSCAGIASAQVNLRFWVWGTFEEREWIEDAAVEYTKITPGVKMEIVPLPPGREVIAATIVAGKSPDLLLYEHNVPWFWGVESIYPLTDFVLDEKIGIDPKVFIDMSRGTANYGGQVIALPVSAYPGAINYNRDMIAEAGLSEKNPPTTWNQLTEWGKKLTKRVNRTVTQWGFTTAVKDWMLQETMFMNGGDWVNDKLTEYCPDTENLIQGLYQWRDWTYKDEIMPVARGVSWAGFGAITSPEAAFESGLSAMHQGGAGLFYRELDPGIKVGVFANPKGPMAGETIKMSPGHRGLYVLSPTRYPKETYLFAKWFILNKALDYCLKFGHTPALRSAFLDPEVRANPRIGPVIEAMEKNKLRNFHMFPGRMDMREKEPEIVDKVLNWLATPEEAVASFKEHTRKVLERWEPELKKYREAHKLVW